jgi:KDO2-lipid IV(A) lauroyltransferase
MQALGFYLALPFMYLLSLLPFWVLFRLSDLMYLLVRLVKYRKQVIETNLKYAFPNKSQSEVKAIRNKFYRHFCDLFFETMKLQTISIKEMKRRMVFSNVEYLEEMFRQKRDVIAVCGHYGNWEWIPSINVNISAQGVEVYHPLKNKKMDAFMLKLRSRFHTLNFTMNATLREVIKLKRSNTPYVIGLISDQSPARVKIQYRTVFLNQNTAVHLGAEKIAQATNDVVVYFKMNKVKRGCYRVDVVPVTETPKSLAEFEITEKHVRILEQQIIERPELWLWSHRRWKYSPDRTAIDEQSLMVK